MTMISHHASIDTLAAYAAGHLDEARNVVVATHVKMCAECRETVADLEALGGFCLETIEPVAMADDAMKTFWQIAAHAAPERQPASMRADNDLPIEFGQPLNAYIKGGLDAVKWRTVAPGIAQSVIEASGYRKNALRLLRIQPGKQIPIHTHSEHELTLILSGSYEDQLGTFQAGDLADLDDDQTHSPVATGDAPCICLVATSAPLVFKNMVGRVIQPFVGL